MSSGTTSTTRIGIERKRTSAVYRPSAGPLAEGQGSNDAVLRRTGRMGCRGRAERTERTAQAAQHANQSNDHRRTWSARLAWRLCLALVGCPLLVGQPAASRGADQPAEAAPLVVCLVSGSLEYESDATLAAFQQYLEANYLARCTRAFRRTDGDLPGLEQLDDCDVMLLFTRRLEITGEQLERIERYCRAGRPIVGVRTASHAFQTWLELDQEVLGGNYRGHYGTGPKTEIEVTQAGRQHPVLEGFEPFASNGTLYRNAGVADDVTVLLTGSIPDHEEPVAWTRLNRGGRVFYTSLGHQDDFNEEAFLRMLARALFWAAGREPAARDQAGATISPPSAEPTQSAESATAEHALEGLQAAVEITFDAHGVPHIAAESWVDAARALGYLHARDRLWQMDMFRRRGSGTLAEVIGPAGIESDREVRILGIRRGCEELWNQPDLPDDFRQELVAYAEGVNAFIAAAGDTGLSLYFTQLGYRPAPWTPVDTLVFNKYMGWDQSGTRDDLWFGAMVDKLGIEAAESLWPLERPYEVPTVAVQVDRASLAAAREGAAAREYRAAREHAAPRRDRLAGAELAIGAGDVYLSALAATTPAAASWFRGDGAFGSNNWAVDGSRTRSGKPLLANDPHLGFQLPSIWYTVNVRVADRYVAGVTFPGGPTVIIGHNDRIAWGLTNLQADAVDFYIETVDADDPLRYLHRGEWKQMERHIEAIAVRGGEPVELVIDSTVHGPMITREGRPISLCWTGLGPTTEPLALWQISRAANLGEFLAALDLLVVPAMNVIYADVDGHIAIHPSGTLPLRNRGEGRVPMDGASGDHDWVAAIPRHELPLAVDPAEHFVASANGRPTPLGYPHYLGWMWDPSYRTRRIHDMLGVASDLTIESMAEIQNDAYDKAAERFLPALIDGARRARAEGLDDPLVREALEAVAAWDNVGRPDAIGPAIWLAWFQRYRDGVWADEWVARGIEQPGGSWGFTGDNRREPMLEVLEYLTRENPHSIWFDDRATPQRETRDDIAARALVEAVALLKQRFGEPLERWTWQNINRLRIGSLTGEALLAREGGPVPGTAFTVNPGGNLGHVGGGASWRMLVDFGDPLASVGVYPGGQLENPTSPHYDDQIAVWARGAYLPLHLADAASGTVAGSSRSGAPGGSGSARPNAALRLVP